jgi:hypothetical protein
MSETEIMLINLIREHKNPEKALTTAIEIIINHLSQECQSPLSNTLGENQQLTSYYALC